MLAGTSDSSAVAYYIKNYLFQLFDQLISTASLSIVYQLVDKSKQEFINWFLLIA